jgi:hypothetical protein
LKPNLQRSKQRASYSFGTQARHVFSHVVATFVSMVDCAGSSAVCIFDKINAVNVIAAAMTNKMIKPMRTGEGGSAFFCDGFGMGGSGLAGRE